MALNLKFPERYIHLQNTSVCPPKSDEIRVVKVPKSSFSHPAIHVVYSIYYYDIKFSLNMKDPFVLIIIFHNLSLTGRKERKRESNPETNT